MSACASARPKLGWPDWRSSTPTALCTDLTESRILLIRSSRCRVSFVCRGGKRPVSFTPPQDY